MKRRHRANEGMIRQRGPHNLWEGRVELPRGENGARRRKSVYAPTVEQLLVKMNALRRDADLGLLPAITASPSVAVILNDWLAALKTKGRRIRTLERYETVVAKHILPALGTIRVEKLTALHIERLLRAKLANQMAPRSVRQIFQVIRAALDRALHKQLAQRNVALLVDAPEAPHREMKVWTPEQSATFLDAVKGERLEALYSLALSTGMRRGELLALRWDAIDLDAARLSVQRSLGRAKGGLVEDAPKTAKGRRSIKLIGPTVVALREHRKRQLEARLKAGPDWQDTGYCFTSSVGTPLDPSFIGKDFRRILTKTQLPQIRLHGLRHSMATLAFSGPEPVHPKVLSEMLGHSKTAYTMDLYQHVLPHMQDEAARKIEAALTRK